MSTAQRRTRPAPTRVHGDRRRAAPVPLRRFATTGAATRETLGNAVAGVLAAIVALADPERVIVGGSWGPAILDSIRAAVSRLPRRPIVQAATLTGEPGLIGARADALERLRAAIVTGD